jgi:hypothetical protein
MKAYTLVKSVYQPTNALIKIQQNTIHVKYQTPTCCGPEVPS